MYRYGMIDCLEKYIENEFNASIYYMELAKLAPSEHTKGVLINLSNDEKNHGERMLQAYYYISNSLYVLKPLIHPEISGYKEGLKIRMLAETEDYKKYGSDYMQEESRYLRNLFFAIRSSEAQHAMRISALLDECM